MDDLVEFIRARLAEDERHLRLLDEHLSGHERPYNLADPTDPARVLRGVEAKRRIVERAERIRENAEDFPGRVTYDVAWATAQDLRDVASEWSDHADYRQEWKP